MINICLLVTEAGSCSALAFQALSEIGMSKHSVWSEMKKKERIVALLEAHTMERPLTNSRNLHVLLGYGPSRKKED